MDDRGESTGLIGVGFLFGLIFLFLLVCLRLLGGQAGHTRLAAEWGLDGSGLLASWTGAFLLRRKLAFGKDGGVQLALAV